MSKRELWEKVDTRTLKPGDVVVNYAGENVVWDTGDSRIVNDNPAGPWHIPCLFRRIPDADNPRVLRRALEIMSVWYANEASASPENEMQAAIDQARRELESEGSDDQA